MAIAFNGNPSQSYGASPAIWRPCRSRRPYKIPTLCYLPPDTGERMLNRLAPNSGNTDLSFAETVAIQNVKTVRLLTKAELSRCRLVDVECYEYCSTFAIQSFCFTVQSHFRLASCPAVNMAVIGARTGGAGGATAPPTKLLGEQVIHPAPPIFFLVLPQFDVSFPEKLLKIVAAVLLEARFLS